MTLPWWSRATAAIGAATLLCCVGTGCTSCFYICAPTTPEEVAAVGAAVDPDCELILIEGTELESLAGLEPLRQGAFLEVQQNPQLSDFSALRKVTFGSAAIDSNAPGGTIEFGPFGAQYLFIGGNDARRVIIDLIRSAGGGRSQMSLIVSEAELEVLQLSSSEEVAPDVLLTVEGGNQETGITTSIDGFSLTTLTLSDAPWADSLEDLQGFGVPTGVVKLYGTGVVPDGPLPEEYLSWLVSEGFTSAIVVCPHACDGAPQEQWDNDRCGAPASEWQVGCVTLPSES